jgi:hypothetical protein
MGGALRIGKAAMSARSQGTAKGHGRPRMHRGRFARSLVATAVLAGLAFGIVGGRIERDATATVLGVLALVVAATQLIWIWRPRHLRPPNDGRSDRTMKLR